jgi:hypothetical protein
MCSSFQVFFTSIFHCDRYLFYCLARRAKYFYWNDYYMIFLITIIAFSSFAIARRQRMKELDKRYCHIVNKNISKDGLQREQSLNFCLDAYRDISVCFFYCKMFNIIKFVLFLN